MGEVRRASARLASTALLTLALLGALLVMPSPSVAADAATTDPAGCSQAVPAGQARCFITVDRPSSARGGIRAFTTQAPSGGISPQAIASIYDLPPIPSPVPVGSSPTVALVEAGGFPDLESELNGYREAYGLGACTRANGCLTILNQAGRATSLPGAYGGWPTEIAMDAEAVAAACPRCRILVVEAQNANTGNLGQALAVAASRADYVSMSWGVGDDGLRRSDVAAIDNVLAAHPDVTFVAATGDYGWHTNLPADGVSCGRSTVPVTPGDTHSCTNYPASSPHVIAAGGTVALPSGADGTWSERVWGAADDDGRLNSGGSSSGCSGWTTMNAAQARNAQAKAACGTARGTADLSALADGFAMYYPTLGGDWWLAGGTSLAAPLLTAMYARAGNHTSPFDIYARADRDATAFTDVTAGGATRGCPASDPLHLCSAGLGWDGPTGLGTPHGLASLVALGSTVPPDEVVRYPTTASVPPPSSVPAPAAPLRPIGHSGKVKLKGKARVRAKLKASYGVFEAGTSVRITWLVKKKAVGHGRKLRVKKAWRRRKIRYVVTASAVGCAPLSLTSRAVKVKR